MKTAIIIGIGSDIGSHIARRLIGEEWRVVGTWYCTRPDFKDAGVLPGAENVRYVRCDLESRAEVDNAAHALGEPWDLLLVASGTYKPLGPFMRCDEHDWEMCVNVNALAPLRLLRRLWPSRKPGASVAFFAGPNPQRANPTYSAYTAGKVILHKAAEDLQAENPSHKFFVLGPGLTRTKMLDETLKAGNRAAYYDRVLKFVESGAQGTDKDAIFDMLKACMANDSGGRNIHIADDWNGAGTCFQGDFGRLRRYE